MRAALVGVLLLLAALALFDTAAATEVPRVRDPRDTSQGSRKRDPRRPRRDAAPLPTPTPHPPPNPNPDPTPTTTPTPAHSPAPPPAPGPVPYPPSGPDSLPAPAPPPAPSPGPAPAPVPGPGGVPFYVSGRWEFQSNIFVCTTDQDCLDKATGDKCTERGFCEIGCGSNIGCEGGLHTFKNCDLERGYCVDCFDDSTCFEGRVCFQGQCERCATNADCATRVAENLDYGQEEALFCVDGECAECAVDEDCAGKPQGELRLNTYPGSGIRVITFARDFCNEFGYCSECVQASDCTDPEKPVCGPPRGRLEASRCVGCGKDADCAGNPRGERCNYSDDFTCDIVVGGCSDDAKCERDNSNVAPQLQYCSRANPPFGGICSDCALDEQCPGSQVCPDLRCQDCRTDDNCDESDYCDYGDCKSRCTDKDGDQPCFPEQTCDLMTGRCVNCKTSADCQRFQAPYSQVCNPAGGCDDCMTLESCLRDYGKTPEAIAYCNDNAASYEKVPCPDEGCVVDSQCGNNGVCERGCKDCRSDDDCTQEVKPGRDAPFCDLQLPVRRAPTPYTCVGCRSDFDCRGNPDGPACLNRLDPRGQEPILGVCKGCFDNSYCGDGEVCGAGNECLTISPDAPCLQAEFAPPCCQSNADCLLTNAGPYCTPYGLCAECLESSDCVYDPQFGKCDNGRCTECIFTADCDVGFYCNYGSCDSLGTPGQYQDY